MENKLPIVDTNSSPLKQFADLISHEQYCEIIENAKSLKGLKIGFLNATPKGGGVAEILSALVPLMKGLGIEAVWHTMPANSDFFVVTKKIHNALHGKAESLSPDECALYTDYNRKVADLMDNEDMDIWFIEDPQPAGTLTFLKKKSNAIWRYHGDTSHTNKEVWNFINSFLSDYKKYIFSLEDFVPENIDKNKVIISCPAINPLSLKNTQLDDSIVKNIISSLGVDASRPLMAQISRFDPWKDPKGVIDVYRLAKKEYPSLQLVIIGLMLAQDDPEALEIYRDTVDYAANDPDIFLFSDPQKLEYENDLLINALQSSSDIIIQKSIREGFGLVVTEALWKEKPVVATNRGGIRVQIKNGETGFLGDSAEEMAEQICYLLKNKCKAQELGVKARKTVQNNFLITRLLNDYLKVFNQFAG